MQFRQLWFLANDERKQDINIHVEVFFLISFSFKIALGKKG